VNWFSRRLKKNTAKKQRKNEAYLGSLVFCNFRGFHDFWLLKTPSILNYCKEKEEGEEKRE
jgi:hypothetical protein